MRKFYNPDTEFVPADAVMNFHIGGNVSDYSHYVSICRELGISDICDRFDEMLVTDYIISNYDRNYRNFGLIRNAETLKFISAAPIFDTGTSLKFNIETSDIFSKREYELKSKPFKPTHHEQIKLVCSPE